MHVLQGDGSPMPGIPGNLLEQSRESPAETSKPFSVQFEVDIVQILLMLTALASRLWMLGHPRAVVYVK